MHISTLITYISTSPTPMHTLATPKRNIKSDRDTCMVSGVERGWGGGEGRGSYSNMPCPKMFEGKETETTKSLCILD